MNEMSSLKMKPPHFDLDENSIGDKIGTGLNWINRKRTRANRPKYLNWKMSWLLGLSLAKGIVFLVRL